MGDTKYHSGLMDKIKMTTKGILQFTKSNVKQHMAFKVIPPYYKNDELDEHEQKQPQNKKSLIKPKKVRTEDSNPLNKEEIISPQVFYANKEGPKLINKNYRDELQNGYRK